MRVADSILLTQDKVSFEHGNETVVSIKSGDFING
jgi:hypothetical protein